MILRSNTLTVAALLWIVVLSGCAIPAHSPGQTTGIEPLRELDVPGTLVARVDGHPRDIEYSINGVRIDPEEEIEWWNDARLRIDLQPGFYRVEAEYHVRGFAGDTNVYRIATSEPVQVRTGHVTRLVANLEKDFRGVPRAKVTLFRRELDEPRRTDAAPEAREELVQGDPDSPNEVTTTMGSSDAFDSPDVLVIRGGSDGSDSVVRIESADGAPVRGGSSGTIVIHGSNVSGDGYSLGGVPTSEPIGLPAVVVYEEDLAPETHDEVPVVDALVPESGDALGAPLHLTVLLRSDPSGARVRVDDRDVGTTPVRVRLDPTVGHVVQFETDDCDHIRLLPAAGWERGRSSTIAVELDCP